MGCSGEGSGIKNRGNIMKRKDKTYNRNRQGGRNDKVIILDEFRKRPGFQPREKVRQEDEERKLDDCSRELLEIFDDLFGPFENNK